MFRVPTDIKAGRAITINGQVYAKDARVRVDDLVFLGTTNALSALLSKGVLYASPDQHARKTHAGNPQPTSLPPIVLNAVLAAEEIQDAPGAPTDIAVTNGNLQVSIAFTAGAAGTSVTTDVEYSLDSGVTWTTSGGVTSPIVVADLVNGTDYAIKLRSINAYGQGAASAVAPGHPATTASAPRALVATRGDRTASIAFTVPSSDGGASITVYEYRIGAGAWTATIPATSASPLVITGLTNGAEVSVTLRAVNAAGNGTASTACVFTPPALIPEAPAALVATPAALAVAIAFTVPAYNGGSVITKYQHSFDDGGSWFDAAPVETASPYNMALPAADYTVVLRAVNAVGNGPKSAPVTFTVPAA
jgi:titin